MGEPVKLVNGRWRDANGQYAPAPPKGSPLWGMVDGAPAPEPARVPGSHLRAVPPPPPPAAPPPPPSARFKAPQSTPQSTPQSSPQSAEDVGPDDVGPDDVGPDDATETEGPEAPPEEAADWAREEAPAEEEGGDAEAAPPPPPEPPQGLATKEVLAKLNIGVLWAAAIRAVAQRVPPGLPPGTTPAPITPAEVAQYTSAWADVADRYFPNIPAGELLVLGLVTVAGVQQARANAVRPEPPEGPDSPP